MLKRIVDFNLRGRISPICLKEFAQLADGCLQKRLTMAEVVVGLESILALQEKSNNTLQPAGMTIFGWNVPMSIFPSSRGNSVGGRSLKSLDIYLYTIGGENKTLCRFDFDTINVATENFCEANIICRQDCGYMYKGRLENGQYLAMLELGVDFKSYEYIMNEASTLVKLEHKNLVPLLGYCIGRTTVYLIYDFVPYATLDRLIFDPSGVSLNWDQRYKILLRVAQALIYLHQHAPFRVIHHDVKPGNILLDETLDPKLSSFWLSRCFAINEPDSIANPPDTPCGTWGYMAPEVFNTYGCFSTKVDVFSFGVLILEIVSGHRVTDDVFEANQLPEEYVSQRFDDQMWRNWLEGTHSNIIDQRIDVDSSLMTRFIHIGLLCIQEIPRDRPTMEEVIVMMVGNSSIPLPIPKAPSWVFYLYPSLGRRTYLDDTSVLFVDSDISSEEFVHGR